MSGFKLMLAWQGKENEKCPRCNIEFNASKPGLARSSGNLYDLAVVFQQGPWMFGQTEVVHETCVHPNDSWMPAWLPAKNTWIG